MTELTKNNPEEKINREDRKIRARQDEFMNKFLREKSIPVIVGQPDSLNENEGFYHAKFLRLLGFSLHKNREGLFQCTFPKGWRKVIMEGKNDWCYLVDNEKPGRADICYKEMGVIREGKRKATTFSMFINYMPRFRAMADHIIPYSVVNKNPIEHYNSPVVGKILDAETVIYETKPIEMINKYGDKDYNLEEKKIRSKLQSDCQDLLNEYLDDTDNIFNYWAENDETTVNIKYFKNELKLKSTVPH